jgi:hypothetical protein
VGGEGGEEGSDGVRRVRRSTWKEHGDHMARLATNGGRGGKANPRELRLHASLGCTRIVSSSPRVEREEQSPAVPYTVLGLTPALDTCVSWQGPAAIQRPLIEVLGAGGLSLGNLKTHGVCAEALDDTRCLFPESLLFTTALCGQDAGAASVLDLLLRLLGEELRLHGDGLLGQLALAQALEDAELKSFHIRKILRTHKRTSRALAKRSEQQVGLPPGSGQ